MNQQLVQQHFALLNGINFSISCERVFRPDLEAKPIVILTASNGYVISRSPEAAVLGVQIGDAAIRIPDSVARFVANFELYADMSERLRQLLHGEGVATTVVSIDKTLLHISDAANTDFKAWASALQSRIQTELGMPVEIRRADEEQYRQRVLNHTTIARSLRLNRPTHDSGVIVSAMTSLTAKAAFQLQHERLITRMAKITLASNSAGQDYQSRSQYVVMHKPSSDIQLITQAVQHQLERFPVSATRYSRLTIELLDTEPQSGTTSSVRTQTVQQLTDRFSGANLECASKLQAILQSPKYTTSWQDLPTARIL